MASHPLDNPIWSSLASRHRALALRHGDVLRYPADVAPFLGVPDGREVDDRTLAALVAPGETVYLVGPAPVVPSGWTLEALGRLVQMVCEEKVPEVEGPAVVALGEEHRAAILELTALVYPHYFRRRTVELGRYFGMLHEGRLAAMAGERMGMTGEQGFREISAVCAHPDFAGRGLARRLLVWLANDILAGGEVPFLHLSPSNTRALRLYEQNGFRVRSEPTFWSLRRREK